VTSAQALVLAGGGIAGIAWETGILRGIADESPAAARLLMDSDVLVGTSAGSAVAAQIATGCTLEVLFDRQVAETSAEIDSGVDIDTITGLFLTALQEPYDEAADKTRQQMRRIGAVAAGTETFPEAVRREVIAQRLPSHDWPERALRVTAIDIATGELVVFDRESGVGLVDAVAASCAVPGVWPPVTIAGRRYMDGGIASSVNLDVASDCDVAVVLVPGGADAPAPFAGSTFTVFADDDSLAAFGPNALDPRCRVPSAVAGREQGRRDAAAVARFLGV
jgi:NTE family protein